MRASQNIKACSITVGNMFKLVEAVQQDMVRDGYCFITEQRPGDSRPRDYIYRTSELPNAAETNKRHLKRPESMELQSHHLRAYFQRERFHPKERYSHLYSPLLPKLVLTYEWGMSFSELRGYLNRSNIHKHNWTDVENGTNDPSECIFNYLKYMCCFVWCIPSRSSPPEQIDLCPMWIDILFNDQNAINIKAELKQAERIYLYAKYHLVIATSSVLVRAWCLFEVMTRLKSERKKVSILHNWSKGPTRFEHVANVFDEMQASYEEDKHLIQSEIISKFGSKEKFQAAIHNIVKESSDDLMQGMCGAVGMSIAVFIFCWLVFVIFAPCTVPFFAIGICGLVYSCVWPRNDYDRMFPSSPSLDVSLVSVSH
jgi:hypothetical protein